MLTYKQDLEAKLKDEILTPVSLISSQPNRGFLDKPILRSSLTDETGWAELLDLAIFFFRPILEQIDILKAIRTTQRQIKIHGPTYKSILSLFCHASNTCFTPIGQLEVSLLDMKMVTGVSILVDVYEEYIPLDEDLQLLVKDRPDEGKMLYFLLDR